mgnify:CR=1 FL=1
MNNFRNDVVKVSSSIVFLFVFLHCAAQIKPKERNILAREAIAVNLPEVMIRDNSWITFPGYRDRIFWESLPPGIRREYISKAEEYLNYDWPVVKATDYLEFIRSGDRRQQVYSACSDALVSLVMGELAEGKGRFLDQIINGVWYYCEQTWWGWSAHLYFQKASYGLPDVNEPTVDLGVGEVTNNLSFTYYLFKDEFDKVHPLISQRLKQEIFRKALDPYFERNDFGYMGFRGGRPNNWNPWVNYNMLTSYLLMETDPERKIARVQKILNSIDKFLNGYSDDGGCDEGPSYWGAAGALLYESLELMEKITGGRFNVFDEPLIRNIGKYFYKVNIHAPYFINFADADATTGGNPSIVYRYGKAINDPVMWKFGAYLARLEKWGEHAPAGKIGVRIRNLMLLEELKNAEAEEALVADFWFPETEIAGGRDSEGSFRGFFFGAKGGFNNESHNHNDVGSFVLYFDGKPFFIDIGREEYTAKTFSSQRYEIWTMQSGWHNLPVINGMEQKEGNAFLARQTSFRADREKITFSADIATAYLPEAKVRMWTRTYTLNRSKSFTINEKYELSEIVPGTFTSSNFITPCKVTLPKPGLIRFEGDGFTLFMTYNTGSVRPEIEFREVTDRGLKRYWPGGVTRIKMIYTNPGLKDSNSFIISKG